MKKALSFLSVVAFLFFQTAGNPLFACGYNYISSCATQLEVEANGQDLQFYVNNCTFQTNFQNFNFGTVTELNLLKGLVYTWESCTNRVLNAKLFYRIYPVNGSPGGFSTLDLPLSQSSTSGDYRNRTFDANSSIDLLLGLTNGTDYFLEVYFASDIDFENDNLPNTSLVRNNNGLFYKAAFKKAGSSNGGLTITFPNKNNVSCFGGSDGRLSAAVSGGTTPYNYVWSNGVSSSTILNVPAGTYSLTVTSANGLTGSTSATITQPTQLTASVSVGNETSASANNGSAVCSVNGGTAPYNYGWSNGGSGTSISNLDAGNYGLTVTDAKFCSVVKTFVVSTAGTVPTGYCSSSGSQPWNEWIGEVKIDGLDNFSDKASYSDFTNLPAPELTIGDVYPITLKTGNGWFANPEFWRIWIDFNRNGIFESSELAMEAQQTPPASGYSQLVVNQSVTIPASASAGKTRMRVSIKRSASPLACEAFQFGETEDYSVNLVAPATACTISIATSNIACNNNGTPSNPADDRFTFSLTATGAGVGSGWAATVAGATVSGNYDVAKNFGPYQISGGAISMTVTDLANANCHKNVVVQPPATCSNTNCSLTASVSNIVCDNNGTANSSADDKFTFSINVSGSGTSTAWNATINGAAVSGTYGQAKTFGPFSISGGALNFSVSDSQNPTCSYPVSVAPPPPCSVSGGPMNYCQSKSDFPWHEWVSKVTFGDINKASGKWTYSDFTSYNTLISRGLTYPVSLFATFSWDTYPEHFRVWIDYNRDGVFQEPGEIAYQGILSGVSPGAQDAPLNGSINVPATAQTGVTRMRVSMKRGGYPTACEALIPFGEVEDYSVQISSTLATGSIAEREIEPSEIGDFTLFPNPTFSGEAFLNLEKMLGKAVSVTIFHATGREMWRRDFPEIENPIQQLSIGELPSGEYFVAVQSPGMRQVLKKMVVLKL